MKSRFWHLALLFSVLSACPMVHAEEQQPVSFSLDAYFKRDLAQDKHEPLLLDISMGNPAAANAASAIAAARRSKAQFDKTGWPKIPEAKNKAIEALAASSPPFVIISNADKKPLASLVSFTISDEHHIAKSLACKLLASSENPTGAVRIDATHSVQQSFGVFPDALSALADGKYEIQANVVNPGSNATWKSNVVSITLKNKLDGMSKNDEHQRNFEYANFYLRDKQYDKVERYAQRLLAADPSSIAAAQVQGDAFFGAGKLDDAQRSYTTALDRFDKRFGPDSGYTPPANGGIEPPSYIESQLQAVLAAKARTGAGR